VKIVNPVITQELERGAALRLDLGCGARARSGYFGVDLVERLGSDIVADLNQPLNLLPDNCCEAIYTRHALEHVQNLLPLMREIHRVCKPDARIEIVVPHFSNVYGHSDPTHVRFFGLYSMYYFCSREDQPMARTVPNFYSDVRFRVERINIQFYRYSFLDRTLGRLLEKFTNLNLKTQDFFERRLAHLFHASQINYTLTPVKG
jgi:SAM-dependent methyltransferase